MSVPGNLVNTLSAPLRWGDMDAEGYAKIVWFDRVNRSSTRLPDTLRALATE